MRASFIDFHSMPERDRRLLFGESIKSLDDLSMARSRSLLHMKDNDDFTLETLASEQSPFKRDRESSWLQKYVISYNNRYKSTWDVLIMLFVIYSSITTAYL